MLAHNSTYFYCIMVSSRRDEGKGLREHLAPFLRMWIKPGSRATDRGEWKRRFYICDRKKRDICSKECHHTSDPAHALYDTPDPWRRWEVFDSGMFEVMRKELE